MLDIKMEGLEKPAKTIEKIIKFSVPTFHAVQDIENAVQIANIYDQINKVPNLLTL